MLNHKSFVLCVAGPEDEIDTDRLVDMIERQRQRQAQQVNAGKFPGMLQDAVILIFFVLKYIPASLAAKLWDRWLLKGMELKLKFETNSKASNSSFYG